MSFMAIFLNGVLLSFALGGVAAPVFMSFVEKRLAKKLSSHGVDTDETC